MGVILAALIMPILIWFSVVGVSLDLLQRSCQLSLEEQESVNQAL